MRAPVFLIAAAVGCTGSRSLGGFENGTGTAGDMGGASSDGGEKTAVQLDVEAGLTDSGGSACAVAEDMADGVRPCRETAPPESFDPVVQWAYDTPLPGDDVLSVWAIPLVGNLTDDNGDGSVDLCDVPDVVVVGFSDRDPNATGRTPREGALLALDGETGRMHWASEPILSHSTPALGDINHDGVADLVTEEEQPNPDHPDGPYHGRLIAYDASGAVLWRGDPVAPSLRGCAVALADADADGDVEILCGRGLYDHQGRLLQQMTTAAQVEPWRGEAASIFADLDGDGTQEVITGEGAFDLDGRIRFLFQVEPLGTTEFFDAHSGAYPQVADFDGDGDPELLVTNSRGIHVYTHTGEVLVQSARPHGPATSPAPLMWARPAAVHNFDADALPEFAMSSRYNYSVFEPDAAVVWNAIVEDVSGSASGTAFDFLGDGTAEAMYADEDHLFAFDERGTTIFEAPRTSGTIIEYPVVADVDNDGAAEIVVVSSTHEGRRSPAVQVIADAHERWVPTRRIWNQHSYHVTNVREDGTIPQHEVPSWTQLNTYRTNAQYEAGGLCVPPPQG